MQVCREPIASGVRAALNALTLGGFSQAARALNYDDVFHLWIVLTLADGEHWRFDKNEVVRVVRGAPPSGECKPVHMHRDIPVGEFFDKGIAQNPRFWLYDTVNNCQRFDIDLLKGNGLLTPELESFILQDSVSLVQGMAKKAADAVTDLAGRVDIVRFGEGHRMRGARAIYRRLPRY